MSKVLCPYIFDCQHKDLENMCPHRLPHEYIKEGCDGSGDMSSYTICDGNRGIECLDIDTVLHLEFMKGKKEKTKKQLFSELVLYRIKNK